MAVTGIEVTHRTPLADGAEFGDTGPYERIDGRLVFAVDPTDPHNRRIVDLDKAARDATGRVGFSANFTVLQPADPAHANGGLLMDIANRGQERAVLLLNRAPRAALGGPEMHTGDGFLMRRGWALGWVGWQWDVPRANGAFALDAPEALGEDGRPIHGQIMCRFQPNSPEEWHQLSDRGHLPYPAADLNQPDAVLYVRETPESAHTVIPRARWRFARVENGHDLADDTCIALHGGFQPGLIYEVSYITRACPVVGAGLLATRDGGSFLRYGAEGVASPLMAPVQHAYVFGISQSGRFLRHYLYEGLNVDEADRQVYDGVHVHIAGARRGEYNHRFAQPSLAALRSFGYLPPYLHGRTADDGGLLSRQRAAGGLPLVIETNTSAEYWRNDAGLLHVDPATGNDVAFPDTVRMYHFACAQHIPGGVPPLPAAPANGANTGSTVDYALLLRAALVNLERWVTMGVTPPESRHARAAAGTLARRADATAAIARIPGAVTADPAVLQCVHQLDLGPDASKGVGRYPAVEGPALPGYAAAVDADGNEVAGIRSPEIAVPIATHTGWNPRHPATGGPGQIVDQQGSTFPFPRTKAERAATNDPRLSIEERYAGRDAYLTHVRAAAEALAAARYLLPEDIDTAVTMAADRWDWVMGR